MSVVSEIERIQNAKSDIKTAIENKGVVVGDSLIDTYANKINEIQVGGSNLEINDCSYLFYYRTRLDQLNEILNVCKNITSTLSMFYNCTTLTQIDLSRFDTSKVTDMSTMFYYCNKLNDLDLSNFDTNKVTNMTQMFYNCTLLKKLDLSNFNMKNVSRVSMMFYGCSNLETVILGGTDTSSTKDTSMMFYNCTKLQKLVIKGSGVFGINSSSTFTNTPIEKGTGYVYVSDELVDEYKSATDWSAYASQIKPLSELEV